MDPASQACHIGLPAADQRPPGGVTLATLTGSPAAAFAVAARWGASN